MKTYRVLAVLTSLFVLPIFLNFYVIGKDTKKKVKNDVCSASNPASICAAEITCGSASSPCSVDIRRSEGSSAKRHPEYLRRQAQQSLLHQDGHHRHLH